MDKSEDKKRAITWIYSQFRKGAPAYTVRETVFHRYYCNYCLENEIAAVKIAREQYGQQGRDASLEVLRSIAMGRIEFYTPRHDHMLEHLRLYCEHVTSDISKEVRATWRILAQNTGSTYINPYDFGSIFELLAFPKTPQGHLDLLVPGSASPAMIYQCQERALLKRSSLKEKRRGEIRKRAKFDTKAPAELDPSATEASDEEGLNDQSFRDGEIEVKTQVKEEVFNPSHSDDGEDAKRPEDFPSSDLLKALSSHAGSMYASRGLMSSENQPRDERGLKLPSMIQGLDGSALVALAILSQELVRSAVNTPRSPEPPQVHFNRKPGTKGSGFSTRSRATKMWTDAVLSALPEGEVRGIRELQELMGFKKGKSSSERDGEGV